MYRLLPPYTPIYGPITGSAPAGGTTIAQPAGTLALPICIGGSCFVGYSATEETRREVSGASVTVYGAAGTANFALYFIPLHREPNP